jgi:hypothetical protein
MVMHMRFYTSNIHADIITACYGKQKLHLLNNKGITTYQDPSSVASHWVDQNLMVNLSVYNMVAQL